MTRRSHARNRGDDGSSVGLRAERFGLNHDQLNGNYGHRSVHFYDCKLNVNLRARIARILVVVRFEGRFMISASNTNETGEKIIISAGAAQKVRSTNSGDCLDFKELTIRLVRQFSRYSAPQTDPRTQVTAGLPHFTRVLAFFSSEGLIVPGENCSVLVRSERSREQCCGRLAWLRSYAAVRERPEFWGRVTSPHREWNGELAF
jgi:hypothetical protein